jgi:hypothetical protein
MHKVTFVIFLTFVLGAATLSLIQVVRGQEAGAPDVLSKETHGENRREIVGAAPFGEPKQPNIGFIDSPRNWATPTPTQSGPETAPT